MITATLMVYGHGDQVNWSDWHFLQLPAPGDVITVKDFKGNWHHLAVRHTEYTASSAHHQGNEASAVVVTDWVESFPPDHDASA